jgi:hypothetical protein
MDGCFIDDKVRRNNFDFQINFFLLPDLSDFNLQPELQLFPFHHLPLHHLLFHLHFFPSQNQVHPHPPFRAHRPQRRGVREELHLLPFGEEGGRGGGRGREREERERERERKREEREREKEKEKRERERREKEKRKREERERREREEKREREKE